MVTTDADLDDEDEVSTLLRSLPPRVLVTAFCFGDVEQARKAFEGGRKDVVRVFAASPEMPFAEAALEAVYG